MDKISFEFLFNRVAWSKRLQTVLIDLSAFIANISELTRSKILFLEQNNLFEQAQFLKVLVFSFKSSLALKGGMLSKTENGFH